MPKTLAELVGETVKVTAGDDSTDDNGICFSFYGKLEAPEDGMNRFYVRVLEDFNGTHGIYFHPNQVREIWKQVYNWEISLKKHLNASY